MTAARRGARPVGGVPPPTHVRARAGVASGVMAAGARGGACAPLVETAESGDSADFTEFAESAESAESTRAADIV
ncbi:Uncharacterised protein [Burkholderia pseudomallei]|nr:hypothetical protein CF640_25455 [Burkholderia pseudomallei]PNX18436.1 hypothetical protein CF645_30035 [Burkholderia pseudomallei]QGT07182.1 hypothetical protein D286_23225 [Burkholderia pseudomallei]CAJ2749488.1 Uncharacterised protein [Burkholderia pseudomallei]CAJ3966558.1 Uncharacterised protein [Burkholderia pseudomallei]